MSCGSSKLRGIFNLRDEWVRELKDEAKVKSVHDIVPTDRNLGNLAMADVDMLTKGLTADVRAKPDKCLLLIVEKVAAGLGYLGGT